MSILNTHSQSTYIIAFQWSTEKFIFQGAKDLILILKNKPEGKGIEYIKRLNPSNLRFNTLSKSTIKNCFDYDTEAIEELQKTNFIK